MNNINNFTNAHQDLIAWVVVILLVFNGKRVKIELSA